MPDERDAPAVKKKFGKPKRDDRKTRARDSRITVEFKPHTKAKLQEMAAAAGLTDAGLINQLVREALVVRKRGKVPAAGEVDAWATHKEEQPASLIDLIFPTIVSDCCCGPRR